MKYFTKSNEGSSERVSERASAFWPLATLVSLAFTSNKGDRKTRKKKKKGEREEKNKYQLVTKPNLYCRLKGAKLIEI